MDGIRNLSGTLMRQNERLVKFRVENYAVAACELLADVTHCPVECLLSGTKERALAESGVLHDRMAKKQGG